MKNNFWSNPWFNIPVLLFFIAGFWVNFYLPYGEEIRILNLWRTEPYNTFFRLFTKLGEVAPYLLIGLAGLFMAEKRAVIAIVFGLVTMPVMYVLKDVSEAERPLTYFQKMGQADRLVYTPEVTLNSGFTSFPSGHTMSAFGLYAVLNAMLPARKRKWGLLCALAATGVGFSRIFLVQHFLADVLAGAAIGLLLSWGLWILGSRLFHRPTQDIL
jgi:membrane-associated phospholipid phosphatase